MDIDPECNYCPACNDEYRPEITTCAACGVALESGAALRARLDGQRTGRPVPIGPAEPLVVVRRGPLVQIRQLQGLLEAHGLAAIASTDGPAGCRTTCSGAELLLQVRPADLAEVLALLDEEHRRTTVLAEYDTSLAGEVFDAGQDEAICPACGCRFATSSSSCPDCGLSFA